MTLAAYGYDDDFWPEDAEYPEVEYRIGNDVATLYRGINLPSGWSSGIVDPEGRTDWTWEQADREYGEGGINAGDPPSIDFLVDPVLAAVDQHLGRHWSFSREAAESFVGPSGVILEARVAGSMEEIWRGPKEEAGVYDREDDEHEVYLKENAMVDLLSASIRDGADNSRSYWLTFAFPRREAWASKYADLNVRQLDPSQAELLAAELDRTMLNGWDGGLGWQGITGPELAELIDAAIEQHGLDDPDDPERARHDEERVQDAISAVLGTKQADVKPLRGYHITLKEYLPSILSQGLQPRSQTGVSNYDSWLTSKDDRVYLAESVYLADSMQLGQMAVSALAEKWLHQNLSEADKGMGFEWMELTELSLSQLDALSVVVLEVDIPPTYWDNLDYDEDLETFGTEGTWAFVGTIPPEWISVYSTEEPADVEMAREFLQEHDGRSYDDFYSEPITASRYASDSQEEFESKVVGVASQLGGNVHIPGVGWLRNGEVVRRGVTPWRMPLVDELVRDGQFLDLPVLLYEMEPISCYDNVIEILEGEWASVGKNPEGWTGWALNGGEWRPHAWAVVDVPGGGWGERQIVETTVPRDRYFGIESRYWLINGDYDSATVSDDPNAVLAAGPVEYYIERRLPVAEFINRFSPADYSSWDDAIEALREEIHGTGVILEPVEVTEGFDEVDEGHHRVVDAILNGDEVSYVVIPIEDSREKGLPYPRWASSDFDGRLGRCYELAAKEVAYENGGILVHGTITNNLGNMRTIDHAWVERDDGTIYDAVMQQEFEPTVYERIYGANPMFRYDQEEVLINLVSYEHWGPWEDVFYDDGRDDEF